MTAARQAYVLQARGFNEAEAAKLTLTQRGINASAAMTLVENGLIDTKKRELQCDKEAFKNALQKIGLDDKEIANLWEKLAAQEALNKSTEKGNALTASQKAASLFKSLNLGSVVSAPLKRLFCK